MAVRLLDLSPIWLERDGRRVALMFNCPHCWPAKREWITCFFEPAGTLPKANDNIPGDREMFRRAFDARGIADADDLAWTVLSCEPNSAWKRTSDDLATLSITPSIDGSAAGHWHGCITNGLVA